MGTEVEELARWECERCQSQPVELFTTMSWDYRLGVCSKYSCPSRAPMKVKLKGGGIASNTGKSVFRRRAT